MLDHASLYHIVIGSGFGARQKPLPCCWADDGDALTSTFLLGGHDRPVWEVAMGNFPQWAKPDGAMSHSGGGRHMGRQLLFSEKKQ